MSMSDQMIIRIHRTTPKAESYGLGLMLLHSPEECVEVELPDGRVLYGVVMSEWDEIKGESRVLTKTIRVHGTAPGDGAQ